MHTTTHAYTACICPFVIYVYQLPEQLARLKVFVDAPVVYLPLRRMGAQALVINCGCLKMHNSYNKLDGEVKSESGTEKKTAYVNKYNFKLTDLQFAR